MGTKIQCKTYLPAFYSAKDLNGHMNNTAHLLNHEEQTLRSVQHYDFFASCVPVDGYSEYDKEKVRQTILKHESIFRYQLQELHRLHRRQMELMNELKMRRLQQNRIQAETMHSGHLLPHVPHSDLRKAQNIAHFPSLNSGSSQVSTSGTSYKQSLFEFIKNENKTSHFSSRDREIPQAGNNSMMLEFSKRTNCLADLNEPILLEKAPVLASDANLDRNKWLANGFGKERLNIDINTDVHTHSLHAPFPSDKAKAQNLKKKTIFGVVISEGNEEPSVTAPSGKVQNLDCNVGKVQMNGDIRAASSSIGLASCQDGYSQTLQLNAKKVNGFSSVGYNYANGNSAWSLAPKECQTKQENSKGALPWFLVKSQSGPNQNKESQTHNPTDLDLLKNCSQPAFGKSEMNESFPQILNKTQEPKPSTSTHGSDHTKTEVCDSATVKKLFGVPIFNSPKDLNTAEADVDRVNSKNVFADDVVCRNQLEAKDDNNVSGSSHQIDLNLSLDEEEVSPEPSLPQAVEEHEAPTVHESEKAATLEAEEPHEESREAAEAIVSISQLESGETDHLKWFAELIIDEVNDQECKIEEDEDSVPDGMDYYEFETLKLRDLNEEGQCYEPSILDIQNDEETGVTTQPKRPRRGHARRGRQRKDFQRDVLPSIISLSKHELSEDILTFEELMRTTGCSWQSSFSEKKAPKSNRGRKRRAGSTTSPPPINQPLLTEIEVEKASLTGWGKRTRRLPRQRCPTLKYVPLVQC